MRERARSLSKLFETSALNARVKTFLGPFLRVQNTVQKLSTNIQFDEQRLEDAINFQLNDNHIQMYVNFMSNALISGIIFFFFFLAQFW